MSVVIEMRACMWWMYNTVHATIISVLEIRDPFGVAISVTYNYTRIHTHDNFCAFYLWSFSWPLHATTSVKFTCDHVCDFCMLPPVWHLYAWPLLWPLHVTSFVQMCAKAYRSKASQHHCSCRHPCVNLPRDSAGKKSYESQQWLTRPMLKK